MTKATLDQLLAQVHQRLAEGRSLDPRTRELLTTVMHDIEKTLSARDERMASPGLRLEPLAIKLQAEHPQLAAVLQQLVDALGKAGI